MPVGRQISTAIENEEGDDDLVFGRHEGQLLREFEPFRHEGLQRPQQDAQLNTASVSVKPTSRPPAIAPYGLPMPPTIAAAKIGSRMLKERSGFSETSSASSVPAGGGKRRPR